MKLDSPREIVKVLRLYLDVGDELLKQLSYAVSYDTLYIDKTFENEMMLAVLIDRVTFRFFVLNVNCSSSYRIDSN